MLIPGLELVSVSKSSLAAKRLLFNLVINSCSMHCFQILPYLLASGHDCPVFVVCVWSRLVILFPSYCRFACVHSCSHTLAFLCCHAISVLSWHFCVVMPFLCCRGISVLSCHFCVVMAFLCYHAISVFSWHFCVVICSCFVPVWF